MKTEEKIRGVYFAGNKVMASGTVTSLYYKSGEPQAMVCFEDGTMLDTPTRNLIQRTEMVAIDHLEHKEYGCPYCGTNISRVLMSSNGTYFVSCGHEDCQKDYVVLVHSLISAVGTKKECDDDFIHPILIKHPRYGIPKTDYKAKDVKPDEPNAEYFRSRGVGYDLAGFVKSKEAGERLLLMVKEVLGMAVVRTWLDFREREPSRIQFKIDKEEFDVEKLHMLVEANNDILTKEMLLKCKV